MAAIADVSRFDKPLAHFTLHIEAPVVDAGSTAKVGPKIIDRESVSVGGAQERRWLIAGRFRDSAVPLKWGIDGIGRNLVKGSACAENAAAAAITGRLVEHTPAAAQNCFGREPVSKAQSWPDISHIDRPEASQTGASRTASGKDERTQLSTCSRVWQIQRD